jgi:hypothetical protein
MVGGRPRVGFVGAVGVVGVIGVRVVGVVEVNGGGVGEVDGGDVGDVDGGGRLAYQSWLRDDRSMSTSVLDWRDLDDLEPSIWKGPSTPPAWNVMRSKTVWRWSSMLAAVVVAGCWRRRRFEGAVGFIGADVVFRFVNKEGRRYVGIVGISVDVAIVLHRSSIIRALLRWLSVASRVNCLSMS